MDDSLFTIKYFGDEARVFESKCLNEILCTCQRYKGTKCCYTAAEIKEKLAEYYERRAKILKEQTVMEFLNDQGIYN